jgi:photoactive yellow protein
MRAKRISKVSVTIPTSLEFTAPDLLDWLEQATPAALDTLAFGVVGLAADGAVTAYNAAESALSGLTASRVIGRNFFTSVAPCSNNFMVAHRFETEAVLDEIVNYVFTFRIAPLAVRLRLLKRPGARCNYLAVEKRS